MVIWPFEGSATACAGPMELCPWKGISYSASIVFAASANAPSTLPMLIGVWLDVGVVDRMYLKRPSEPFGSCGVDGFCQLHFSAFAAAIACSSRSQTTAT